MIEKLKALCAFSGVSGNEDDVREFIISGIKNYADEIKTDVMGNILALKKGAAAPARKIMLCAHMDEVGIIVTSITDDGYLKFDCVGGIDRRVLIGKTVFIGKDHVFGVIGNKAVHLVKPTERESIPKLDDMYIDIGAQTKAVAETRVKQGDTGAFSPEAFEFGDGFIKAKALDDRIGCAVLMDIIKQDIPCDCHFVFTVQEEVGLRGAATAAYKTAADTALIVEGTTAADIPGVASGKKICTVGGGAVIPFMDGGTIYDRGLYETLTRLAAENGIEWQTKTYISGGTDGAAIQRSRGGVKTAGIAVPVRNIHSPSCVCAVSDIMSVRELAYKFLEYAGKSE